MQTPRVGVTGDVRRTDNGTRYKKASPFGKRVPIDWTKRDEGAIEP
jgi:hypothetical protein